MTQGFTGDPVVGAIRGYRWWRATADGMLRSAWWGHVVWTPGKNGAECYATRPLLFRRRWRRVHEGGVPAAECGCGFYGLHRLPREPAGGPTSRPWRFDPELWAGPGDQVFGAVEAWGHVLIGTEGWRSEFARPLAVFIPERHPLCGSASVREMRRRYGIPVATGLRELVAGWGPRGEMDPLIPVDEDGEPGW